MSAQHRTSQKTSHHGKILTQNSSLLKLLRDKSKESLSGLERSKVSSLSQHSSSSKHQSDTDFNQHANHFDSSGDEELAIDLNALQHSSASNNISETPLDSEHSLVLLDNHFSNDQSTYRLDANTSRTIPHIDFSGFRDEPEDIEVTSRSDHSPVDTPVEPSQRKEEEFVSRNSSVRTRSVIDTAHHRSSTNTPRLLPIERDNSGNTPIKSSSSIYAVANPDVLRAQGISPPLDPVQFTPRSSQSQQSVNVSQLTDKNLSSIEVNHSYKQNSSLSQPLSENSKKGRNSVGQSSGYSQRRSRQHVTIDPQLGDSFADDQGPDWGGNPDIRNRPPTPFQKDTDSSLSAKSVSPLDKDIRPPSVPDWNTPRDSPKSKRQSQYSRTPDNPEKTLNLRENSNFSARESNQSRYSSRPSERSEKQTFDSDNTPTPVYQEGSVVHYHQIPRSRQTVSPQPRQFSLKKRASAPANKGVGSVGMTDPRPTVKKVYVDSPTFTKDEEEEYRFVSSRLDEFDNEGDDRQDTFRQLEMDNNYRDRSQALSGSPQKKTERVDNIRSRKANTELPNPDRYEDRNEGMYSHGDAGAEQTDRQKPDTSNRFEARNHKLQRQYSPKPVSQPKSVLSSGKPPSEGVRTEVDELKQEAEYQMFLKERIKTNTKHDDELEIPGVPKMPETEDLGKDEGRDFVQDSLEFPQQPEQLNGYERDSLDLGESVPAIESGPHNALVPRDSIPQYSDWKNPPPNPFGSRTSLQSDQNMRWQHRFPPDFIDENDTAKMELLHPKEPKINFVENNKFDYGKPPDKSYQQINERRRTEEETLESVFIKPKVSKPKIPKSLSKGRPSQSSQLTSPLLEESLPLDYKPTSAEEYWAKRSAYLSRKKETKMNSGKSKASSGKNSGIVRKAGSSGNIPMRNEFSPQALKAGSPRYQHLDPLLEQRPLALPPPVVQQEEQVSPVMQQMYRKPLELKPITQEIVTEDGQRISVDINLKVVSPPPGAHVAPGIMNQPVQIDSEGGPRPIGLQYQQYGPPFEPFQQYEQQPFPYYQETQEPYAYRDFDPNGGAYPIRENGQVDLYDSNKPLDESTYSTNPYNKIPPILSADNSPEISDIEGGYAAQYKKQRQKDSSAGPQYKVYNLEDYKKMKREWQLGRGLLGPDLDNLTYKEKLEKRHKQFEYARMVMEKNRHELSVPDKRHTSPKVKNHSSDSTKRRTALEYAKDIPKPVVKPRPNQYNSYEVAAQLSPASKTGSSSRSPNSVDVIDLQKLQQRHEQEKQNVAMIRQNMSGPVPQKA